jgi:hypothetical protein
MTLLQHGKIFILYTSQIVAEVLLRMAQIERYNIAGP